MVDLYPPVWVIAGPTASGKSALSLAIAQRYNGVIINADSMQVYREIPIIGAQPTAEEQESVPHRLYGYVSVLQRMSAPQWAEQAVQAIREVQQAGQQPILVGGSGMYLAALIQGFAPMPAVPAAVRQQVSDLYDMLGPEPFHVALRGIDPITAARLHPTDRQRCIRAREIFQATGKPLSAWQAQPKMPPDPDLRFKSLVLLPERDWLYDRINERFEGMVRHGAIEEARHVQSLNPDATLTGVQALGLQALRDYLEGRLTLFEAIEHGQTQSRQFAKRQYTWFRGQSMGPGPSFVLSNVNDLSAANRFFTTN